MLKVLVVDDDIFVRNDIRNMIDWEENGFILMGEAINGHTAIKALEEDLPDIIITDISMPIMNGIALIEYVKTNFPHIQIIALSGYDDFDYVRQSMVKGAKDYILKHRLNGNLLLDTLKNLRTSIGKAKEDDAGIYNREQQISIGKAMQRKKFIKKLLSGGLCDVDFISSTMSELDLNIDIKNIIIVIMEIDDYPHMEEKYSSEEVAAFVDIILEVSNEAMSGWEKVETFHADKGRFIFILSIGKLVGDYNIYTRLIEIIGIMRKGIGKLLNLTACFSISTVCSDIEKIHKIYDDAQRALQNKFYSGKDRIYTVDSIEKINNTLVSLTAEDEKNVILLLKNLDSKGVMEYIEGIFNKIMELKPNYKSVQMICVELISIINKTAREYGLDTSFAYLDNENPYYKIQKYENINDIKNWLVDAFDKLISQLNSYKISDEYNEHTKNAMEYINNNYMCNISLDDVACHIGVSSFYLSRLFKNDCGIGFNEFLNRVRVEKAKDLIRNDKMQLKEVVSAVGFNNYNYFFRVFKNITNMTPVEYRDKNI